MTTVTADVLRQLHRIHKQLADLNGRLDQGPRVIRTAQAVVNSSSKAVDDAAETLKKARMASDDKQLQLKEREMRIESLKAKLNTASSNKEFQALKEQIAADEQANSVLSDEILEALEKLDELEIVLSDAKETLSGAQAEFDKTNGKIEAELSQLTGERDRVQAELDETEKTLPGDFRVEYERVARVRHEDTLAQVDGETCGSCNTMLTPNSLAELQMAKPVFCNSCGALLYFPEDRSVSG